MILRKWYRIIPARIVLCAMIFLAFFNLYTLRNMLNVALVSMSDEGVIPEEIWKLPSHEVILSSFFPLYVLSNIFAGTLSSRFGGKITCGLGVGLTAVATFFVPVAANHGYGWLMLIRVIQGIFEGFAVASFHTLFGKWFPKSERAILKAFSVSGTNVAFLLGNPITGYLCASNILGGWPAVFYLFGLIGVISFIIWWILVYESPADHPHISEEELRYILDSQGDEYARERLETPWFSILTSCAFWSLVMSGILDGFYTEFVKLVYPTYLSKVYHYDVKKIGWLTMLPHLLDIIVSFIGAGLGDFLISRNPLNRRTLIRKCVHTLAVVPLLFSLVGVVLMNNSATAVVALITVGAGFRAINAGGSAIGFVEMSPVFAGSIYGVANGIENLVPFVSPLIIAAITAGKEESREQWNIVFYIALAAQLVGLTIYLRFASADLQPWGLGQSDSQESSPAMPLKTLRLGSELKSSNRPRSTLQPGSYKSFVDESDE